MSPITNYPLYLANKPITPNHALEVTDKYSGQVAFRVPLADEALINRAIEAGLKAEEPLRSLPAYARQAALLHCVKRIEERSEELARVLCIEAGKPIRDSRGEVGRLLDTFRIAAEESVRLNGEVMPLDRTPRTKDYTGFWKRVPVGLCSFISPFNFPLNLAAHKIAPALAVGCPFILKPASLTPVSSLILGEILAETALPEGAFSILPCHREGARLFTEDERFKLLSFTGSPEVGWDLKARAGKKKVVLELGGNAACILDEGVDLEDAVNRLLMGAFYQSGQSCISVQRVLIHESFYEEFKKMFIKAVQGLKAGNPLDEDTFIGPLISEKDGKRLEDWIRSAEKKGAKVLCGGKRNKVMMEPTVLEHVPQSEPLYGREAFGPVVLLSSFKNFDAALDEVNASEFGLQAGVFTRDIHKAHRAWERLNVGGVIIGDVPSFRADAMPYGGVKDSGFGREGVRFAMEDMTEIRLMVVRSIP